MIALLKSKTFWTGIVAVVTGVGLILTGDVSTGTQTILGGILAICIKDAIVKG